MRASLVSGFSLANIAKQVDLGAYLILGRGEEITGGRSRPRILAGAFEAVVGAYFIQHGWEPSRTLVVGLLFDQEIMTAPVDPKTSLQELVQRTLGSNSSTKWLMWKEDLRAVLYNCLHDKWQASFDEVDQKRLNAARIFL